MKLKKMKQISVGIIIGCILTLTSTVLAESAQKISAYLANYVKFEFDGVQKASQDSQGVLMYQDKVYVPARFVAEAMGGKVVWDSTSHTVKIQTPQPKVIEKVVYVEKEESKEEVKEKDVKQEEKEKNTNDGRNYNELPIKKTYQNFDITATGLVLDDNETKVYLSLENKGQDSLQLQQRETIMEVDGKEYKMENERAHRWDTRWYSDIREDEILDGYISFGSLPKNSKNMHIELKILKQGYNTETSTVSFDIKIN